MSREKCALAFRKPSIFASAAKDGLPAHSTLPDQVIEIDVAVNYRALAGQAVMVTTGAAASAIIGAIVTDKWPAIKALFGL